METEDINPLVVELVLSAMEPHYLTSSRFVNRAWNSIATRLLNGAGHTVPMRSEEFRKYLKKVKRADESDAAVAAPIANLGLATHIDFSWPVEETIQQINQICKLSERPPLSLLGCGGSWGKESQSLLSLTRMNAPSLRQLSFQVYNEDAYSKTGAGSVLLDFELPALKSVRVDYFFPWDIPPPLVVAHVLAAPNLEHLRLFSVAGPGNVNAMLNAIYTIDPRRLSNLKELDLPANLGQLPEEVYFTRLHTLRLYSWEAETAFNIPEFVPSRCPVLRSVEFEAFHFGARLPERIEVVDNALPQITRFGFKGVLRQQSRLATLEGRHDEIDHSVDLPIVDAFLRSMNNFPNLVSVSLQFENLVALSKLFMSLGGSIGHFIPPAFCVSKWPTVKRLTLTTDPEDSYSATPSTLDAVGWLVNEMYPNLQKLCLALNGDTDPDTNVDTNSLTSPNRLRYALALVFGMKGIKKARIDVNHYTIWDSDFEQIAGPKLVTKYLGLDSLTIGLVSTQPLSARSPDTSFIIPKLLALIPESPSLLLRIDARLPLSGCDSSYGELRDELAEVTSPRVVIF